MPERSRNPKRTRDPNQVVALVVDEAAGGTPEPPARSQTAAPEKNPHAAALGSLGGKKGGPARAMRLSAERRSEIAREAARARWHSDDE